MDKFEEAFEKMKSDGKTSVDAIISWMKDSKLIENTSEAEEKARKLFADVSDAQNVQLEKFKEALQHLATQQKKTLEDFTKIIGEEAPRLVNALMAGASAFKEALGKK